MQEQRVEIKDLNAVGYVIPLQTCNLVFAIKENSMLACGAIDIHALNKFKVPAAKVTGVASVEDLLAGEIKDINEGAKERGLCVGISGREGLMKM